MAVEDPKLLFLDEMTEAATLDVAEIEDACDEQEAGDSNFVKCNIDGGNEYSELLLMVGVGDCRPEDDDAA